MESMEPRQMLSAAVSHGVLSIDGTRRADTIVLTMDSPRTLRVRVGDTESTFLKKTIGSIRINTGRGDDLVTVGSDAKPITLRVGVTGGDGSDTIVGGAGSDTLSGGAGADQVTGAGGDDRIAGDNGNDDLHGGDGRDSLTGGRGDDQLHDDAGRDAVYGNAGTDVCYYHDDVKQFRDAGKTERTYEEPKFVIQLQPGAVRSLDLNICPLYAPDGTALTGGLVKAGGSTLVVAGNAVGQWGGEGLTVTHAFVPHFDLPGGSFVSSGLILSTGSLTGSTNISVVGSGSFTSVGGTLTLTGSNTYTGTTTINTGTLTINGNASGHPILLEVGSVITAADGTTQTLAPGGSLTVTGPSKITTPAGQVINVNDGASVLITGRPADTTGDPTSGNTTTGDTTTSGTTTGNTTTGDTTTSDPTTGNTTTDNTTTDTTTGDTPTPPVDPDPTTTTTSPTEPA
jgi:autotransporter-associated beta strand protein